MKTKKAQAGWIGGVAVLIIAVALIWAGINQGWFSQAQTGVSEVITEKEAQSCSGVQSVNALYNDLNAFATGTDPSSSLTVTSPIRKTIADDATTTTVPILSNIIGLAGNSAGTPSTSYFGQEIAFESVCSDVDVQPELYAAGAPTMTILHDDGVTKSTSANNQTVAASTAYSAEITLRAPADQCSAVYGGVLAIGYDATYIEKIEEAGGDLTKKQYSIYAPHAAAGSSYTHDQWETFEWKDSDGKLCDGEKATVVVQYTHTSTAASDDGANMNVTWWGINKDLNADNYELITGIYDESNNLIGLGEQTGIIYTTD